VPTQIVAVLMDRGAELMAVSRQTSAIPNPDSQAVDIWPVYEAPLRDQPKPYSGDSSEVIADMVSVLSANEHGSTAEALAFLRQVYPRYPLTLRLAAIVAYSKSPLSFSAERPVAQ
jgi:hypothetical protein